MQSHLWQAGLSRSRGSGIVEGVVGAVFVMAAVVGGILLAVNLGVFMYHKHKIAFVANQCALYAASRYVWNGFEMPPASKEVVPEEVQSRANEMLQALGLPPGSTTVEYQPEVTTVTVAVSALGVVGDAPFLPRSLSVVEKGVALNGGDIPPALLAINIGHNTRAQDNLSVLVPCYGRNVGAGGFSPGSSATPAADKRPHPGAFTGHSHSDICLRAYIDPLPGGSNLQVRQQGQDFSGSVTQSSTQFPDLSAAAGFGS